MKPYLLKVPLQRKDPELRFDVCQVDHVHELSDAEFQFFQRNLMQDADFLHDYNLHYASPPAEGVRNGLLVLGKGHDDGVFVCTEGYDYARYSAYVPNARQLLLLKQYPALEDFGSKLAALADRTIRKALTVGLPEPYQFSLDALGGDSIHPYFNADLFLDLLGNRPEVEDIETDRDEIRLTMSAESLPKREQEPRALSPEDFKIACAKHLLWIYGAEGGEQADFRNREFPGTNFSNLDLSSAVFDGAVFQSCTLHDASLCFASFRGCVFLDCGCCDLTAEEADFRDAVFDHCRLDGAVMTHSSLSGAVFQDCCMDRVSLKNCLIQGMRLVDSASPTLNMVGTTTDAEAWSGQADQQFFEEELQ